MYLVLLYRTRDEIIKKKNKGTRSSDNGDGNGGDNGDGAWSIQPPTSPTGGYDDLERMLQEGGIPPQPKRSYLFTDEISFLYEAYKPEYWYWEVSLSHMAGLGVVSYACEYFNIMCCICFHYFRTDTHALVIALSLALVIALSLAFVFFLALVFYLTILIGD